MLRRHFSHLTLVLASLSLNSGCSEAEEPVRTAVVYVAAGTEETTALAGFYGETFGLQRCLTDVYDRCLVTTCFDGGSGRQYVDGGSVEFRSGELEATLDTGNVPDENDARGPGLAVTDGLPVLASGERVTMKLLGGGSVSPTEGAVTMPERLQLTEPELVDASCSSIDDESSTPVAIDGSQDFELRWETSETDDVDIIFRFDDIVDYSGDEERDRFTSIRCLHTADEQRAEIPRAVVERMPTNQRGSFTVRQITSNAKLVGNWSVTFGGYWEFCSAARVD